MNQHPIETSGTLCESELLSLGWPEEHEFEPITELRNKSYIRRWFLNDRVIDLETNRRWLARGMDRPKESLLSVRLKRGGIFLGTIGWSDWDPERAEAWFGRIAVDPGRLRRAAGSFPQRYAGVALDATISLLDFAFARMRLKHIYTYFITGNALSEKLQRRIEMEEVRRATRTRGDGTPVETVELRMTRERWEAIRAGVKPDLATAPDDQPLRPNSPS